MSEQPRKHTAVSLKARKGTADKIVALTAYDATMARLLDEGGADVLMVGDSLGMVVQGHATTLPVTVEEICYHGRAVARGTTRAHLVGDLPFMSFQVSPEQALVAAGRLIKEGSFESVKLEGGVVVAEQIHRIVAAGIPVMGHVGLTPQSVHRMGGFRVQGKGEDAALAVLADAQAVEQAGAFALVVEGVPASLGRRITERSTIPTIGIGAGPDCDGQVLVCYDFLGMVRGFTPKFVKHFAELGDQIRDAARAYGSAVRDGSFPDLSHSFADVGAGGAHGSAAGREASERSAPSYGPGREER
ncbi:MAG TPA: 3-methyl-2-oxobutanoate hydroxymethyltransferase [Polyangiaceae bacterium]|nr:3-methyl-2-oxobutanoate hydroxymethyltransferase [Polyangiaceae bacterium]